MQILLIQPRGFCAGVKRAIKLVEAALERYGAPIWVLHEIVHNTHVLKDLGRKGAIFEESIENIPDGAYTLFSAHGVSSEVEKAAAEKGLKLVDATCPLVKKVHYQLVRYVKAGNEVVLIGHHGHPEVEGTRGRVDPSKVFVVSTIEEIDGLMPRDPEALAYVTQTTLSINDTEHLIKRLQERFPNIKGPSTNDICFATQSRQQAVMKAAKRIDLLLVVGSKNSSNSNRLRECGEKQGVVSYLLDDYTELDPSWFREEDMVGITAGASAPEKLVQELVQELQKKFTVTSVEEMEVADEALCFNRIDLPEI